MFVNRANTNQPMHDKSAPARPEQTSPSRARLTAADWEKEALALIAEEGVGSLGINPLAQRLGVTKGSFYWHFRNRAALLDALLSRWERHSGSEMLEHITSIADPRARLRQLFLRVAHEVETTRVHAALLKGTERPRIREVVERTAQRYLDVLVSAYRQTGMSADSAAHRAQLTYAAYVGFLQLTSAPGAQRLDHVQFDSYIAHMVETLVPPA